MDFYRCNWPGETVTPKLHMLEDHAVDFMAKWGSSFGIYGEQGAESIHAAFNTLKIDYRNMRHPQQRLKAMLKEHYLIVHPKPNSLEPKPNKRKKKEN